MYCCLVFMSNTHTHPHTRHMWEAKMTAGCAVLSVFSSCSLLRNGTKEHTIHIPYLAGHSFSVSGGKRRFSSCEGKAVNAHCSSVARVIRSKSLVGFKCRVRRYPLFGVDMGYILDSLLISLLLLLIQPFNIQL